MRLYTHLHESEYLVFVPCHGGKQPHVVHLVIILRLIGNHPNRRRKAVIGETSYALEAL
jgi:hypothetical protein